MIAAILTSGRERESEFTRWNSGTNGHNLLHFYWIAIYRYIQTNIWQTIGQAFRCTNLRHNKLMQVRPATTTTTTTKGKPKMKSASVSVRQSFFQSHFLFVSLLLASIRIVLSFHPAKKKWGVEGIVYGSVITRYKGLAHILPLLWCICTPQGHWAGDWMSMSHADLF